MGKRNRGRGKISAPTSEYRSEEHGVLTLRGSMTPSTRQEYKGVLHDQGRSTEDSWHRAVEFLFERMVTNWEIHQIPTTDQKELLMRFRVSTPDERRWIRDVLREHLAEHFPDVEAP